VIGVSVAYAYYIGKTKIKLLTEYENVTQKVDSKMNIPFVLHFYIP
jgi:hypothetical protein